MGVPFIFDRRRTLCSTNHFCRPICRGSMTLPLLDWKSVVTLGADCVKNFETPLAIIYCRNLGVRCLLLRRFGQVDSDHRGQRVGCAAILLLLCVSCRVHVNCGPHSNRARLSGLTDTGYKKAIRSARPSAFRRYSISPGNTATSFPLAERRRVLRKSFAPFATVRSNACSEPAYGVALALH
jgi:hypothetical protein